MPLPKVNYFIEPIANHISISRWNKSNLVVYVCHTFPLDHFDKQFGSKSDTNDLGVLTRVASFVSNKRSFEKKRQTFKLKMKNNMPAYVSLKVLQ